MSDRSASFSPRKAALALLVAAALGVPVSFGLLWLYSALRPVTFVLVVAAAVTVPVSLGLLWLYNRSVLAGMRRHGSVDDPTEAAEQLDAEPERPLGVLDLEVIDSGSRRDLTAGSLPVFRRATRGPWASAAIYAIAGLGYALVATAVLFLASGLAVSPLRALVILWVNLWPVVIAVDLVTVADRRARARNVFVYVAAGALLALVARDNWFGVPLFWALAVGPATIFLFPLLHPRLRAVGPLVFAFMVVGVGGALVAYNASATEAGMLILAALGVALQVGDGTPGAVLPSGQILLDVLRASGVKGLIGGVVLLGLVLFGLLGWLALAGVGRLYQAKYISDQSIIVDLVWLIFALNDALDRSFEGLGWGVVALGSFAVYKALTMAGFAVVTRQGRAARNHRLLLLRVFGFRARSQRLMSVVGSRWRYVGSIQLIAATDLASTTVEPHEFLDFTRGKLADRYVKSRAGLERQLVDMDLRPDGDGRFRVNDFFCHDDTWKMTLSQLVAGSDLVLMDLRGFSPANQGCCFEIEQLVNLVPLGKVVLVVDRTTDVQFLRDVLERAWLAIPTSSPNRHVHPARVTAFHLARDDQKGAELLLAGLAEALTQDVRDGATGHATGHPSEPALA